ncbi:EAL and HDOD domain-containing protein [Caldimonas tepidiphila]|uniref:EAL and HDOD domain-containing protein n=1 Tax=Caldimonas tepidiphila TaxID=2315841 RepID=UPI000E5B535E|nr:HDOD domain-containing protein [Caldimonas tepidiphila]
MNLDLLGLIALSHAPVVDRQRAVTATRLTVSVLRHGHAPAPELLLQMVEEVWPAGGLPVSLNILNEALLAAVLEARLPASVMVELPSFMACDPAYTERIRLLYARGVPLLLHGLPQAALPPGLLGCFRYSVIELAHDRRIDEPLEAASGGTRSLGFIQSGVHTVAEMEDSFRRGAVATMGWPIEEVLSAEGQRPAQPDLQALTELMRRVDAGEDVDKLEAVLKRDPSLAFQLMRYINSPAFGLSVEISSFGHAIMLLGYKRLKRWLALLLATASRDANMRPLMYASVRRGLLMEQLLASQSADEELRSELFICGVFSLLDRMFQRSFSDLLGTLPVPERVQQALVHGSGPFQPYLDLACALEQDAGPVIAELAGPLMLPMPEVNAALLRALVLAAQLD